MRTYGLFVYFVVISMLCVRSDADSEDGILVVKTEHGAVRGHRDPGTGVFAFYSIPYATVPLGSERFKVPNSRSL